MTKAICIDCGAEKRGAFVTCPSCGYLPDSKENQAKSMLLSDHYLSQVELSAVSNRIESGQTIEYDEEELQQLTVTLDEVPQHTKVPIGCDIRFWLVVLFILVAVFIALPWLLSSI